MGTTARTLVAVLATALALSACASAERERASESAPAQSTEQAPPETTTAEAAPEPEPVTAAERAWLRAVKRYARGLEREARRSGVITHASMRREIRMYDRCRPMLRAAGDPGRLEPALEHVERACTRLDKAARRLEVAIDATDLGGAVVAGTVDEERFDRAFTGALEATGNARYDLQRAVERAEGIERDLGR